jgi:hypothetical protein
MMSRPLRRFQRILQGDKTPPAVSGISVHARRRWAERKGALLETLEEAYAYAQYAGRRQQWTGWQYRHVVFLCEQEGDNWRIVSVWTGRMWAKKWFTDPSDRTEA